MTARALAPARSYLWKVAAPVLIENFRYDAGSIGLLFSIFNWVFTVAILFAGPFVDRVRARVAYGTGASLWSIGTILSGIRYPVLSRYLSRARLTVGVLPHRCVGSRLARLLSEHLSHHRRRNHERADPMDAAAALSHDLGHDARERRLPVHPETSAARSRRS